ncbi:hypothetical protein COUCH_27275 [Couchioplanes caeruleus]|uniref:hypothetical protein n=1 Tax=Couchioplanes caeruleus TaxID=56438 RepID=UPI0020C00CEF|nr:hypothetical protein [Couchioplanes caeruleus]UQU62719.1 hypothetical protein COUCH_27275 [Couchioplanes caeruleus]
MAALVAVDARHRGREAPGNLLGLTRYLLGREYENAAGAVIQARSSSRSVSRPVNSTVPARKSSIRLGCARNHAAWSSMSG